MSIASSSGGLILQRRKQHFGTIMIVFIMIVTTALLFTNHSIVQCSQQTTTTQKLTPLQCENLGFKSSELACSTCKEFSLFMSEKSLIENCNQCCQDSLSGDSSQGTKGAAADEKEFTSGTLYFCYCNLRSFPEIEGFVNNDAKKIPNLTTAQRQAIMPTLTMKRRDGSEESHLVSHWKIDEIKEFLSEKLKQ